MFQLKKDNCVWWPVTICVPTDGGKVSEYPCQVKFEIVSQDEFDLLTGGGDISLIKGLLKGWKEIGDVEGKDLPYNDENIKAILMIPYVRTSFIRAYMQAAAGAPVKN